MMADRESEHSGLSSSYWPPNLSDYRSDLAFRIALEEMREAGIATAPVLPEAFRSKLEGEGSHDRGHPILEIDQFLEGGGRDGALGVYMNIIWGYACRCTFGSRLLEESMTWGHLEEDRKLGGNRLAVFRRRSVANMDNCVHFLHILSKTKYGVQQDNLSRGRYRGAMEWAAREYLEFLDSMNEWIPDMRKASDERSHLTYNFVPRVVTEGAFSCVNPHRVLPLLLELYVAIAAVSNLSEYDVSARFPPRWMDRECDVDLILEGRDGYPAGLSIELGETGSRSNVGLVEDEAGLIPVHALWLGKNPGNGNGSPWFRMVSEVIWALSYPGIPRVVYREDVVVELERLLRLGAFR